jgi:mevalonate kinase
MKVAAPGKLILSGEHAVVHGHPALALAIDRYVRVQVAANSSNVFSLHCPDLNCSRELSRTSLLDFKKQIQKRYAKFLNNKIPITKVLQKPWELAELVLSLFLHKNPDRQGLQLSITSEIPIGAGLGSSAALILSLIAALQQSVADHAEWWPDALTAENMQHGVSSGLDLQTSFQGGCVLFHDKKARPRPTFPLPLWLVNTGTPVSSTGECVMAVHHLFANSQIGSEFAAVTKALDTRLESPAFISLSEVIKANHRLLQRIGVVPQTVQQFIGEVEAHNSAAKICGAGAVRGEKGGIVLVLTEDPEALNAICQTYGYQHFPVKIAARGLHVN